MISISVRSRERISSSYHSSLILTSRATKPTEEPDEVLTKNIMALRRTRTTASMLHCHTARASVLRREMPHQLSLSRLVNFVNSCVLSIAMVAVQLSSSPAGMQTSTSSRHQRHNETTSDIQQSIHAMQFYSDLSINPTLKPSCPAPSHSHTPPPIHPPAADTNPHPPPPRADAQS